jgi:hypothetical protein
MTPSGIYCLRILGAVPKQTIVVPKRTKVAKKTFIEIPILRTASGGGAEKYYRSAETEKIGAETEIRSAEKSAETGGNHNNNILNLIPRRLNEFYQICSS